MAPDGTDVIHHNEDELRTWLELHLDVRNTFGDEVQCVCPFHQSMSTLKPDLYVNLTKGVFHCLSSSCGAKGHISKLVVATTGCTPEEAARTLGRPSPESLVKMLEQLSLFDLPKPTLTWRVIDRYRQDHPWWEERGISINTQAQFNLGFDFERDAATIPYLDVNGDPHSMIRRFVNPVDGMKYHYPQGFPRDEAIFNLYRAMTTRQTIVVEGPIDAIRVQQNIDLLELRLNVVALFGSHTSDEQIRQLRHLDLILMFDPDPAGKAGQEDFQRRFPKLCQKVTWPYTNTDPGSLDHTEFWARIGHASLQLP